ncbi:hypothetical protein Tco_0362683 [Tanacetum coccineum]
MVTGMRIHHSKANTLRGAPFHETRAEDTPTDKYGYIKNHKKTVKNGQARARESEENKKKPKNQSRGQKVKDLKGTKDNLGVQVHLGSKKRHSPSLIGPIPKEECHVVERKAQVKKKIALVSLTELAQHVTSKNDMLAILRCPQYDPMAQD